MCVPVMAMLPPTQQAYMRSAASAGVAAYEEVYSQGLLDIYIEHTTALITPTTAAEVLVGLLPSLHHAPVTLPIENALPGFNDTTMLAISNEQLSEIGECEQYWPLVRLRYIGGGCRREPLMEAADQFTVQCTDYPP